MLFRAAIENTDGKLEMLAGEERRPSFRNAIKRIMARLSGDGYRPEKHYMRGPGPKAKAKADAVILDAHAERAGERSRDAV